MENLIPPPTLFGDDKLEDTEHLPSPSSQPNDEVLVEDENSSSNSTRGSTPEEADSKTLSKLLLKVLLTKRNSK